MTRAVFGRSRARYRDYLRIDLATCGISHVAPGGGATAAALRVRWLHQLGLPLSWTLSGATVQATASNLLLGWLFLVGVGMLAASGGTTSGAYATAGSAIVLASMITLVAGWAAVRHRSGVVQWLRARAESKPVLGSVPAAWTG